MKGQSPPIYMKRETAAAPTKTHLIAIKSALNTSLTENTVQGTP